MALLTDLASLDNVLTNLIHAIALNPAIHSPSGPASPVALEQEKQVERTRKQLQSFYEALVSTTFPTLAAADRRGASEHALVSQQSGPTSISEQSNQSFSMSSFAWVGDSLCAEAMRGLGGSSPLEITRAGIQRLAVLP